MRKIKILALAAAIFCLSVGVCGSYAYIAAEEKTVNVITAGNVKINLVQTTVSKENSTLMETGSLDGLIPGQQISRIVQVENTGDNPAYIRIHVNKIISLEKGKKGNRILIW